MMKHSSESSMTGELDLPTCKGLPKQAGKVSMEQMMRLSRHLREWFPQSIPTLEELWKPKHHVEFIP